MTWFCSILLAVLMFVQSTRAEFKFERIKVACDYPCMHGGCEFSNCPKSTTCAGGGCHFKDCWSPSCVGGSCLFDNCIKATCQGGGCDFINQKHTLTADACVGENCRLDGVSHPVLHRNEFLTI